MLLDSTDENLQQKQQMPSQVTAEDKISLLLKQRKNTLRECLGYWDTYI